MCCGEGLPGHHGRHGFHHGGMMHSMNGCCCSSMIYGMHGCCGEEMHGHIGGQGFRHGGMMHSRCCGGRRFQSRKERIEILEEYRDSLLSELEGVEEELKALKNE